MMLMRSYRVPLKSNTLRTLVIVIPSLHVLIFSWKFINGHSLYIVPLIFYLTLLHILVLH